jgi:hypothetical protein
VECWARSDSRSARNGFPHSRLDRCQQRSCTNDIHDARQILGEHAERHLARDLRQCLHQEVRRVHPYLERAEGMLNRLAPAAHGLGILMQPLVHGRRLRQRVITQPRPKADFPSYAGTISSYRITERP